MFLMFFLVLSANWVAPTHLVQAMGASDQYTSQYGYVRIVPAQAHSALSGQSFEGAHSKPISVLIREMREPVVRRSDESAKYDPDKLIKALNVPTKRAEPNAIKN